ncbi:peptidyl-Lys metalloendopeptidase [Exidia glandulosa HHB12029]|uniref:Peptidyl-Lys metalloendopeptidase n=1 Tax=Exidia glandulosa HHB12029 TaxID=1314781 RepID=A0A165BNH9_EXIGL|nr:peptidyl-Lys metalloendopeptidase [Exidia glandulosa HHB12029]
MLSSALVALALSVSGALAAPGLSLQLSGANSFAGVNAAVVSATLTNTGDETLKLLNHPNSILSKLPTNTFAIASAADGKTPAFKGAQVKYSTAKATSFTVLAPGESVTVDHSLAEAYDFTRSGAATYSIEPVSSAFLISTPSGIEELHADTFAHTAHLSGSLAVERPAVSKRATFVGCSSSRQTLINTAASNAQSYAAESYAYLSNHTSTTTRYTTWFGTYTAARHTTVTSHYQKISARSFAANTYDCTCTEDAYAYTYADEPGNIWLCTVFWDAPATGTDSKAGTLIHESSHWTATAGTDDHAYGQSAAKSLAKSSPATAVDNADNHEYFAENTPALA